MIQQVDDFREEAAELGRLLMTLTDKDWVRPTQFKAWTIDDIVRHLHIGDVMALASAESREAYVELMNDVRRQREKSPSKVEEARRRLNGLNGRALLERWRETVEKLCDALSKKPPETRLAWAGPDMGLRMFATARQMETWSHGQAIYDIMAIDRPAPSLRLRNIAEIGVRTFGWAYRNRGFAVPAQPPSIRLTTPFGGDWKWAASPSDLIAGPALAFCQVVTQTRNVADTTLMVRGAAAEEWLVIVQCFAGPPETPPPAGARCRSPVALQS